jgi:antitoxin component HigA of HigAB toxin-antitoxin module
MPRPTPRRLVKRVTAALGLTQTALAARIGCQTDAMHRVIAGRRRTTWIRRALAAELFIPYLVLWGEEDPGGHRARRRPSTDPDSVTSR